MSTFVTNGIKKSMAKRSIKLPLLLLAMVMGSTLLVSVVHADACTYREAIMALEKGNAVRGMALMRMASRDGDRRAESYLQDKEFVAELPVFVEISAPLKTASINLRDTQ